MIGTPLTHIFARRATNTLVGVSEAKPNALVPKRWASLRSPQPTPLRDAEDPQLV